jgi:hypothetical protein
MLWFFLDIMNDSALLGVNQGFGGGFTHVVLALLFPLGLVFLFWIENQYAKRSQMSRSKSVSAGLASKDSGEQPRWIAFPFAVAVATALGIGFHALV